MFNGGLSGFTLMILATTPAPTGATAFTDGEAQTVFHGDRAIRQPNSIVVTRHHHFTPSSAMAPVTSVVRYEAELRAVVGGNRV